MAKITKEEILLAVGELFAKEGMSNFSIRAIANHLNIAPSLIYYYFKNEDDLLLCMFQHINRDLGEKRKKLLPAPSAIEMLRTQLEFQIEHQASIVAVLKYYLRFRRSFPKLKDGFLPEKSTLHIGEILAFGQKSGEFQITDLEADAKFIAHAINGYLLEYFPHVPSQEERKILVNQMYTFILKALEKKSV